MEVGKGREQDCMDRYLLLKYLHSPHPYGDYAGGRAPTLGADC